MAILAGYHLPSIERVAEEGFNVVTEEQCLRDGIRRFNIGFLNLMPDKALTATERQFIRLVSGSDFCAVSFMPFTIGGIQRSAETSAYIDEFYSTFEQIKAGPLDALIITGANITQAQLTAEPFWHGLEQILLWADHSRVSTVCSCLATHAAFKVLYGLDRRHLGNKCWGLFEHELCSRHSIANGVPEAFYMPHSRFNEISRADMESVNVEIILASVEAGVQMAIEKDLRRVYFQGHPEYEDISLLKEYKREVYRFALGEREEYPPCPANYFSDQALQLADQFKVRILASSDRREALANFPEDLLARRLNEEWRQPARKIFNNWLLSLQENQG